MRGVHGHHESPTHTLCRHTVRSQARTFFFGLGFSRGGETSFDGDRERAGEAVLRVRVGDRLLVVFRGDSLDSLDSRAEAAALLLFFGFSAGGSCAGCDKTRARTHTHT